MPNYSVRVSIHKSFCIKNAKDKEKALEILHDELSHESHWGYDIADVQEVDSVQKEDYDEVF